MLTLNTQTNSNHEIEISTLSKSLHELFPTHPFSLVTDKTYIKPLLQNYLAMSMTFPYLQSASCAESILDCLKSGNEIPEYLEKTTIVGSFLVWDELGGWHNTYKKAHAGLPGILDSKQVHANLLKRDLETLFGEKIQARFDEPTKEYLLNLYKELSSLDPAAKCAAMVTFELHAEKMISSLWMTVSKLFSVENKDSLKYFSSHVGGDDPAEAYHVKMTQKMVDSLIKNNVHHRFMAEAVRIYFLHFSWCQSISSLSLQ